jgi:hypothetical protein
MLWGLIDVDLNALALLKIKGGNKWQEPLVTLTSKEF